MVARARREAPQSRVHFVFLTGRCPDPFCLRWLRTERKVRLNRRGRSHRVYALQQIDPVQTGPDCSLDYSARITQPRFHRSHFSDSAAAVLGSYAQQHSVQTKSDCSLEYRARITQPRLTALRFSESAWRYSVRTRHNTSTPSRPSPIVRWSTVRASPSHASRRSASATLPWRDSACTRHNTSTPSRPSPIVRWSTVPCPDRGRLFSAVPIEPRFTTLPLHPVCIPARFVCATTFQPGPGRVALFSGVPFEPHSTSCPSSKRRDDAGVCTPYNTATWPGPGSDSIKYRTGLGSAQ